LGAFISGFASILFVFILHQGLSSIPPKKRIKLYRRPVLLALISNDRITNSINFINDAPYNYQITFQDPATRVMEGIISFHYDLMFYLIFISSFVLYMLIRIIIIFNINGPYAKFIKAHSAYYKTLTHHT